MSEKNIRILVFGDSITYGAWDTEGGWVERLKRIAHTKTISSNGETKIQVINLGIGGDTSNKILKRMPDEIRARESASWEFLLLITYGANDERIRNGSIETSITEFEENTKKIIQYAKKFTKNIIFIGPPPIGKNIVNFKGQEYSDQRIEEYETRLKKILNENFIQFIDLRSFLNKKQLNSLFAYDYIHLNDEGHRLIAEYVRSRIKILI